MNSNRHFLNKAIACIATHLLIITTCFAQPPGWMYQEIAPGLEWYQNRDTLTAERQWINVLIIDLHQFKIALAADSNSLKPVSQFAEEANALAAINGNFFHTLEGGSVCFTKVNGIITDTTRYDLPARWFLDQIDDAALIFDGNTRSILPTPDKGWTKAPYPTIITAGPPLILNNEPVAFSDIGFNTKRFGRTAVGITSSAQMVWLTVSGREPGSTGYTMKELQTAMRQFNCTDAINFDGGSSATMWIKKQGRNGIVSVPGWKEAGEKKVGNALVITPI